MAFRRYYFSLLELILALMILSVISGVISMRAYHLIGQHRFKNNEKRIKYFLRYSYSMALSHQTDIIMTFTQKKKGLQCEVAVEGDMGLFKDQPKESFYLKDFYLEAESKTKNRCFINFTSTGFIYPQSKYRFSNASKKYTYLFNPNDPGGLFKMEEKKEKIKTLYPFK